MVDKKKCIEKGEKSTLFIKRKTNVSNCNFKVCRDMEEERNEDERGQYNCYLQSSRHQRIQL